MSCLENLQISLTAPSRQIVDQEGTLDYQKIDAVVAAFKKEGTIVHTDETLYAFDRRFAGSDEVRAQALNRALMRGDDCVIAMRGGYGLTRLLSSLHWAKIKAHSPVFMGFSDSTALSLALLAKINLPSWQGMVGFEATKPGFDWTRLVKVLTQNTFDASWKNSDSNDDFLLEGMLWGGNLSVLTSLLGSEFFPQVSGGILFLEDVHEANYRVERMLWQLAQNGVLQQQKAILLGDFAQADRYRLNEHDFSLSDAFAWLESFLRPYGVKVIKDCPLGHFVTRHYFPVGVQSTLKRNGNDIQITATVR